MKGYMPQQTIIGIVGPCAAGKSTLISGLLEHGISARHIAQEHSYVQDMWQRITHPNTLIFLDVSYVESMRRRPMNWTEAEFLEQYKRLEHAKAHANLYIYTDLLSPQEVLQKALQFLQNKLNRTE